MEKAKEKRRPKSPPDHRPKTAQPLNEFLTPWDETCRWQAQKSLDSVCIPQNHLGAETPPLSAHNVGKKRQWFPHEKEKGAISPQDTADTKTQIHCR